MVLLIEVGTCHDDWKESHQRRRSWAVPEEALQLLTRPNLIHLLRRAIERLTAPPDSKRRSAIGA